MASSPRAWRCAAFVLCLSAAGPVAAAEEDRGTFTATVENDLFYDTDRHYTSGVSLTWTTPSNQVPGWLIDFAHILPLFPREADVRAGFTVGQSMFTPEDIRDPDPPPDARPYAGWLYFAAGLVADTGARLDRLQLSLGVVGPASLAGPTQKAVHHVTGSHQPRGWDTQLDNEPALLLTYQRSWRGYLSGRLNGFGFDVTPHAGFALGNVFTYANAGATLRVGRDLPYDYGPPRIEPALPGSGFFLPTKGFGWYLFAGVDGRAVARNIFLDGNTFAESRSVDKRPFVGDLQVGAAVTLERLRLAYTHVFRTREFGGQDFGDEFGTISLSVRF